MTSILDFSEIVIDESRNFKEEVENTQVIRKV